MKSALPIFFATTLVFSACGGDDEVTPEQLKKALVEQGVDEELASCMVTEFDKTLSQDDFSTLANAEALEDVPADLQTLITDTVSECAIGG